MHEPVAVQRFPFAVHPRPLLLGGAVGIAIVLALLVWRSGRGGGWPWDIGLGVAAGAVAVVMQLRAARRDAARLGAIELDGDGVRWRLGDGSLGFDVPWAEIVGGVVEAKPEQLALLRRDGTSVVIGVVGANGGPAGHLVVSRFSEVVAACRRFVVVERFAPAQDPASARNVGGVGAAAVTIAAALLLLNRFVVARGVALGGAGVLIPASVAVLGGVLVIAALALARGRGPMVSAIHHPDYAGKVRRVLLIAVLADLGLITALWLLG